jgi:hypothetical protein
MLLIPGTQFIVRARNGGKPFPSLGEQNESEQDPDYLYPESNVMKQFLKILYQGIGQWRGES